MAGENQPVFTSSKSSTVDSSGGQFASGPGYIKTGAGTYTPYGAPGSPVGVAPPQTSLLLVNAEEVVRDLAPQASIDLLPQGQTVPLAMQSSGVTLPAALNGSNVDPAILFLGLGLLALVALKK